jgi:hypothetical protein
VRSNVSVAQRATLGGTYRVVVCRALPCVARDTARAMVWGDVVFSDGALARPVRDRFPGSLIGRVANGCYNLWRARTARSLAGIEPEGLTYWERDGKTFTFTLYRSPDAANDVRVTVIGDTLRGTARSWGPSSDDSFGAEYVEAIRIGPPNTQRCASPRRRSGV